ncbi:MAG: hypothetical protein IPF85_03150 [Anaerolineae bacterium]|nr:hypothetical protein [Anaerolineae bacterium]
MSWLLLISSDVRLVSWPISAGSAVSWAVPEVERRQSGELADFRRQRRELVAADFERRQAGELADFCRQRRELIAGDG